VFRARRSASSNFRPSSWLAMATNRTVKVSLGAAFPPARIGRAR